MLPEPVQIIACEICFNLGVFGLSKLKQFIENTKSGDWIHAAI